MTDTDPVPLLARAVPKATITRVRDTYGRAFRPRFLEGSPPNAWRLARTLEDLDADPSVIVPFYYWVTARAEAPLYRFVTDVVYQRSRSHDRRIRIEEAASWLSGEAQRAGKTWTPTVALKTARGILAALRDFGLLEGGVRKRIAAMSLAPRAFALIAFCLHTMGLSGRKLVEHADWRLFLLGEQEVERLFLECHDRRWLRFETAGSLCRIDFPEQSFEEYAHAILGGVD